MNRTTFVSIVLSGALLGPATGSGQPAPGQNDIGEVSCVRGGLQRAVDHYLAAQTSGDTSGIPLAATPAYIENMELMDIGSGLINTPLEIDHHRSLLDTATCQTFTEVIVADEETPYVLGTRLRVNHDRIAEIEILWTTTGYWLFDADSYLAYSSAEDWGPIPAAERDSRATLVAAANAYLDAFLEGRIDLVPWGFPCQRIEGGAYIGTGSPDDSCERGVPANVNISNRRFVVDEVIGSVVAYCTFGIGLPGSGGSGSPDTHLFRVENGKLRYVHTLTHLLQASFGRGGGGGGGGAGGGGRGRGAQQ